MCIYYAQGRSRREAWTCRTTLLTRHPLSIFWSEKRKKKKPWNNHWDRTHRAWMGLEHWHKFHAEPTPVHRFMMASFAIWIATWQGKGARGFVSLGWDAFGSGLAGVIASDQDDWIMDHYEAWCLDSGFTSHPSKWRILIMSLAM